MCGSGSDPKCIRQNTRKKRKKDAAHATPTYHELAKQIKRFGIVDRYDPDRPISDQARNAVPVALGREPLPGMCTWPVKAG